MQRPNAENQYQIGRFTLPSLIIDTNRYLKEEPEKIYLLLPFLLFSTLSYFLLDNDGGAMGAGSGITLVLTHVIGLFINAYYVFSMQKQAPGLLVSERGKRALYRVFPQIKTELATAVRGLVISIGVTLVMMLPLGALTYLYPEWSENPVTMYLVTGFIVLVVFIVMVRFLLSTTITILNKIEGFAAVRLSVLIFKKNRLHCYLYFIFYFAVFFGLLGLSWTQQNKSIQTLISMGTSAFSFYFIVMEAKLIESIISPAVVETET